MTLATISFLCPLAMVMKRPLNIVMILYVVTFFTAGAVVSTKLGNNNITN